MAITAAVVLALPGASAQAPVTGRWLHPFSENGRFDAAPPSTRAQSAALPPAVNVAVLPDGRILYWEQIQGSEAVNTTIALQRPEPGRARTRVLSLRGPAWSTPSPVSGGGGDLTGSEQRQLPDGRVLVIGGTRWANDDSTYRLPNGYGRTELYGLRDARIFDPTSGTWSLARSMHFGRYYPTLLTLPSGRLMVFGGVSKLLYNFSVAGGEAPAESILPQNVRQLEVFDPRTGDWRVDARASSQNPLPLFPRLTLLPNGKLLYTAVGMLFAPGGEDASSQNWGEMQWFDPMAGTWSDAGPAPFGVRSNAFSVLLPLRPPYNRAQILIGGGTLGNSPSTYVATSLSELITWNSGDKIARSITPPLKYPRWFSSAVVLPDGEVIALNGADRDEVIAPGTAAAIRTPEIFDPETQTWSAAAPGARDRTLHNTAILLADGSILVGGHAPAPFLYGSHQGTPPPLSNNFKDPSFEIFQPPYLFRGPRPIISGVSKRTLRRTDELVVDTPDASNGTLRVILSRLPATTHIIDADQRTIEVAFRVVDDDTIEMHLPTADVLPPGPYYFFLLKDNGRGPTPSIARIVLIEP